MRRGYLKSRFPGKNPNYQEKIHLSMDQERYIRQISLKYIGKKGQERISSASAVIIGCGGLGSNSADLLVRAGIGKVVLVDRDIVEKSDLHRQRYTVDDLGMPKPEALANHLERINPDVRIEPVCADFNPSNALDITRSGSILLDGTDNMYTRFIINDSSFNLGIPWVYGGAVGVEGMCSLFLPPGACFRCLFPVPPPEGSLDTCVRSGVLSSLVTLISSLEVTLAIQWILGKGMEGELISFNIWNRELHRVQFTRRKGCTCCSKKRYEFLEKKGKRHTILCGGKAIQILPERKIEIDLRSLGETLKKEGKVSSTGHACRVELRDGVSLTIFRDGRAIITGTTRVSKAKSLYSIYVGD
jgi:adenylyltransferase/sulfurtransferase